MSVLNRKLGRDLLGHWIVLLAIVGIIAVGVACFVMLASSYNNLTRAKAQYYRQCRMAEFWIDLKKVPLAELEPLAELPGVAEIRPRIQFFATVDLDPTHGPAAGPVTKPLNGQVLSLPDRREPVLNDIQIRRGGYFTEHRQNEVIVNDAFATKHKLEPGQWIRLLLNNRRQELFIVGTAISSEFVYLLGPGAILPDPEHYGVFYLKRSYAEDVFDFDGAANQVIGRLAPEARDNPREILRQAEVLLEDYGVFSTTPLEDQASNNYLSQEIEGLKAFAFFLPAIFLVVAALVLNVLLTRLAEQQRTVVGTLKALGYSNGQVFLHFLKFGLSVGLFGGLAGCGLGYVMADLQTGQYRHFFEFPELNNDFYPGIQAAAVGISLVCAAVGGLRGARSVLKLQPAEAMRPKPPRRGGKILLERIHWLWSRLSSGWRMVLRGVFRNRVRTAAGVFATMMGASVLVSGFMSGEATYYMIDFQFEWLLKSDFDLAFKDERGRDALREASRLPGVDRAEPVLYVACTLINGPHRKKGTITGLAPDATLTVPRDREARPIRVPSAGLAMERKLAEILHVERGDWIVMEPVKGLRQPRHIQVVDISDSFLGTSVYADIRYLSRLVDEEYAISGVQVLTDGDPHSTEAFYRELKRLPQIQAVNSRADMVANLNKTFLDLMWVFLLVLIVFAGIMFFGSILNASLVSLAERQREIATLRVLGYGPWQIGSLLLRESLIVTLIGTLLGMPLGYLLAVATSLAYDTEMFRFPVVSSLGTWIWTLALAVLFALAAHLVVQRSIHKMDWLEAMKVKE